MPRTRIVDDRVSSRLPSLAAAAVFILSATASALLSPTAAHAADASVQIRDFAFGPGTVTVAVGDTVTWTNSDSAPHTATAESGAFDSGNLDAGQSFSFTFTTPGTYVYRCDYHSEMQGTIVVEAAATPASAPTSPPEAAASPGSAHSTASRNADDGRQPDTALPTNDDRAPLIGQLLIGLGLVALAFGLVPSGLRRLVPASKVVHRRMPGWRR